MASHLVAGTTVDNVSRLHAKYGDVVRLSPNEISFISGETAWPDIYGFRTGKMKGHENMQKDPAWYAKPPVTSHIIVANDADHTRFRRVLSHAFSEKALAQQEPLLQGYVDLLINRLKEVVAMDRAPQDMTKWYNWTTFDIVRKPIGTMVTRNTWEPRGSASNI
jgi:cytochrome P450